jgi:transposase InsO family protein
MSVAQAGKDLGINPNLLRDGKRSVENCRLLVAIRAIYRASRGAYRSPQVHAQLQALCQRYGRNRIARIMHEHKIQAKRKRKFGVTTDSKYNFPASENVLDRKFDIETPNKAWTADINIHSNKRRPALSGCCNGPDLRKNCRLGHGLPYLQASYGEGLVHGVR